MGAVPIRRVAISSPIVPRSTRTMTDWKFLTCGVQRHWVSMRLSYTFSKAIDNLGEFFFSSPINNLSLRQDRSRSDDDQRHRVVFNAMLNSPASAAHGFVDHLTHGWKLNGILQYYSALPFNIITGTNTRQATSQRPCAPGFTLVDTNPCTEALAGAVIGRNAGIGFDSFTLNTRVSREFALTDRVKLEGIAQAFNTLNHRNQLRLGELGLIRQVQMPKRAAHSSQ